jgi:hypothetical protein
LPANGSAFARQHSARNFAKLTMDERSKLFQRLRVTAAPRLQQSGYVRRDHCPESIPSVVVDAPILGCREFTTRFADLKDRFRLYK